MIPRTDFREELELIARLRPVKPPGDPMKFVVDDKETTKCACNKTARVIDLPIKSSGVVEYLDNVCRGCESSHCSKHLATVVCVRCRRVVGRIPSSVDRHGFKVVGGKHYHFDCCPMCESKIQKSVLIEMKLFHMAHGVE